MQRLINKRQKICVHMKMSLYLDAWFISSCLLNFHDKMNGAKDFSKYKYCHHIIWNGTVLFMWITFYFFSLGNLGKENV